MTKSLKPNNKENIYSLNGFGKVYRFTFKQTLKNKGFLIAAVAMILMMGLMKPFMYILSRTGDNATASKESSLSTIEAEKLYILNESDFVIDKDRAIAPTTGDADAKTVKRENVTVYNKGESTEESLIGQLSPKDILVIIRLEADDYMMNGIISDNSEVSIRSLDRATEYVGKVFYSEREKQISLDESSLKSLGGGISTEETISSKEFIEEKDFTLTTNEYKGLLMGFSLIIMIVAALSSSYIIASVNEEKQSKLAETLLVSVRPMALLLGKVLGMLTFVMGTILCGVLMSYVSDFIMTNLMKLDTANLGQAGINLAIFTGYGVKGVIIFLAEILIALLAFGLLSGIMGSSCSKSEDQQNATTIVTVITMVGYFVTIYFGTKADFSMIGSLVPPISFFLAPSAYIAGRIGLGVFLGSCAIQIAIVIGLLMLGAKTYRNLLLSDSSSLKLQSVFAAAKN